MNNKSGSALAKVSFVLLLLIAGAVGYLVVRERLRNEQRAAAEAAAVATPPSPETKPTAPETPMRVTFAPLRPRIETNATRGVSSRLAVSGAPSGIPNATGILEADINSANGSPAADASSRADFGGFAGASGATRNGVTVAGRVVLRGTPPAEKVIPLDPSCGRLHTAPLTTRHYLVGSDGGLANTFVYIKAGAPAVTPAGPGPLLDQVGCEYQPYMMGVQAGQTFQVKNSDSLMHNVHAMPKAAGNKERNVGQPVKMTSAFVFASPEVFVRFKCDVHPWMFAYVGVVNHPWFAVTDKNGNFALPAGLPPGRYTLAAVHLKAGELLQQINVPSDAAAPVTFTFDVPDGLATAP